MGPPESAKHRWQTVKPHGTSRIIGGAYGMSFYPTAPVISSESQAAEEAAEVVASLAFTRTKTTDLGHQAGRTTRPLHRRGRVLLLRAASRCAEAEADPPTCAGVTLPKPSSVISDQDRSTGFLMRQPPGLPADHQHCGAALPDARKTLSGPFLVPAGPGPGHDDAEARPIAFPAPHYLHVAPYGLQVEPRSHQRWRE
ncbi:hypothetical protein MMMDOFMJ_4273 [Methylobacterium gnaphalii]|nr:hypothetical protein MMMDOFMJ_4273 [Methylobacterium gnaphalii]